MHLGIDMTSGDDYYHKGATTYLLYLSESNCKGHIVPLQGREYVNIDTQLSIHIIPLLTMNHQQRVWDEIGGVGASQTPLHQLEPIY